MSAPGGEPVEPEWIVLAMLFSGVVGVFFGWYPALRASQLDPIEALRHTQLLPKCSSRTLASASS